MRQGNENGKVHIYRYVTEGTFDSYSWQLIENKQKFIGQIMTGKSPVRSCEDIDETALSYAEVKALATGNPYIREKMDLDVQVSRLRLLKANYVSQKYRLEDNIVRNYPERITALKEQIEGYRADIQVYMQNKFPDKDSFSMKLGDRVYMDKKEAGIALIDMCRSAKQPNRMVSIGEYQGFKIRLFYDSFFTKFSVSLKGYLGHDVEIGTDPLGNLQRLNHVLEGMPVKLEGLEQKLIDIEHQLEIAKIEVEKPFVQEQELNEKLSRLAELNALLNMDETGNRGIELEEGEEENNREPEESDVEESLPEMGEDVLQSEGVEERSGKLAEMVGERWTEASNGVRSSVRDKLAKIMARMKEEQGSGRKERERPVTVKGRREETL